MKDEGWQLSTIAWGAALFVFFYLGFLRRVTGAAATAFHRRRSGRFEKSWSPPVDVVSEVVKTVVWFRDDIHIIHAISGSMDYLLERDMESAESYSG